MHGWACACTVARAQRQVAAGVGARALDVGQPRVGGARTKAGPGRCSGSAVGVGGSDRVGSPRDSTMGCANARVRTDWPTGPLSTTALVPTPQPKGQPLIESPLTPSHADAYCNCNTIALG
eukprot:scaffold1614_cov101-Isochrysis_galbana.AAC.6